MNKVFKFLIFLSIYILTLGLFVQSVNAGCITEIYTENKYINFSQNNLQSFGNGISKILYEDLSDPVIINTFTHLTTEGMNHYFINDQHIIWEYEEGASSRATFKVDQKDSLTSPNIPIIGGYLQRGEWNIDEGLTFFGTVNVGNEIFGDYVKITIDPDTNPLTLTMPFVTYGNITFSNSNSIPEPPITLLFGSLIICLGFFERKKKYKKNKIND